MSRQRSEACTRCEEVRDLSVPDACEAQSVVEIQIAGSKKTLQANSLHVAMKDTGGYIAQKDM